MNIYVIRTKGLWGGQYGYVLMGDIIHIVEKGKGTFFTNKQAVEDAFDFLVSDKEQGFSRDDFEVVRGRLD